MAERQAPLPLTDMTTNQTADRSPASLPPVGRGRRHFSPVSLGLSVVAAVAVAFVALPLLGIAWRTPWSSVLEQLSSPAARAALQLSVLTSAVTALCTIVLGTPLAWLIARHEFVGRRLLRAIITVPVVLPPVVSGVALLAVFGRSNGLVGRMLFDTFGTQLTFSPLGVIVSQTFVAMPFYVLAAEAGFTTIDRRFEQLATTLGASEKYIFAGVTLRLAAPALLAGVVLAWARALGEFGATITFAGNIEGRTQTLPLAVYLLLESDPSTAYALSMVMVSAAIAVLVALRGRYLRGNR